ncbi:MAG: hypothetical protein COV67_13620 [Nitrospinae bacterium CG11_big_fil_rev_8_21_14_0_20_56_8]|nr:MAG: hypothetical protein COV67_13620 [Nitrospinae bacterium CG11_big_fil_rev_8_21_14_0_20_56_8]
MLPFTEENLEEVHRHALQEYPYECCGIIAGTPGNNEDNRLYRCTNIQNELHQKDPGTFVRDARTAFYIDPRELMSIFKEARNGGRVVKVFYHSHPEHDAYFSEEDRRMALFDNEPTYPEVCYLVVSVYDRKVAGQALFAWNASTQSFEKLNSESLHL